LTLYDIPEDLNLKISTSLYLLTVSPTSAGWEQHVAPKVYEELQAFKV